MDSYDNTVQDTSNFGVTNDSYNAYDTSHQDNYQSQQHSEATHDHYSFAKESDNPKIPEPKSVEFNLPSSLDETSDLIDIQKDDVLSESQESTSQLELGNYENSIIDHFDSVFINLEKDTKSRNEVQNTTRNETGMSNQNNTPEKDDYRCCSCNGGPLVCLAFFCDCFGGL
ncbi:uncharacterized protein LOC131667624 [Phymastichus coffea]|uniref:uncharacterized protein LOC131667624 n=1 Tax=Phymastichus coffea TaxID=108790 RepID=UPI00273C9C98|nr:uncharacterized protein LOC131667624 [Phymastichus coffea]